jgi:hypothetical protein
LDFAINGVLILMIGILIFVNQHESRSRAMEIAVGQKAAHADTDRIAHQNFCRTYPKLAHYITRTAGAQSKSARQDAETQRKINYPKQNSQM